MASTITLSPDHAYLLGAVVAFYFTNLTLGALIGPARAKAGIKPPVLYATPGMFLDQDGKPDQKKWQELGIPYNQKQRGHLHLSETEPTSLALMLCCGVFYPAYAAKWGASWVFGSLAYGIGYGIKPSYRIFGELFYLPAQIAWIYGLYCAGSALRSGASF